VTTCVRGHLHTLHPCLKPPNRSRLPSLRPPPPVLTLYPHPNLTRALLHVLALALVDRSGEPVQVNAARYTTYHDAEGIGAFLDADFKALTSVLSFTVDYLAGTPRHVDAAHSVAYTVPQSGAFGVLVARFAPVHEATERWTRAHVLWGLHIQKRSL